METILAAYGLDHETVRLDRIGNGLINHTWKVTAGGQQYVLQRINDDVFTRPADIAYNLGVVSQYLKVYHPLYPFIAPLPGKDGSSLVYREDKGYYRLFPFVAGSHSKDTVSTADEAYEAARQFGRLTALLNGLDPALLKTPIPGFHDLGKRYNEFRQALKNSDARLLREAATLVKKAEEHSVIVDQYRLIMKDPAFRLRVTHHDTKISNVLFNDADKGICVIDLDTLMPGHFISDIGDMMRTYLSPASEEEKEMQAITVRDDFYRAIVAGYSDEMKDQLTPAESGHYFYAGLFMTYMQALRFLTDHLLGDRYYSVSYPGQNLVRAANQLTLLERLLEKNQVLGLDQHAVI